MNDAYDVVIPTIGRQSLAELLASLARASGPPPERVIIVDDRVSGDDPLPIPSDLGDLSGRIETVTCGGRGPAAARNAGAARSQAPWLAFLDDDVRVGAAWRDALLADLRACAPNVVGSQARLRVPLPAERRPTDWERNVRGLERARYATADLAYRRHALTAVGGFDERFPRAFREDADLALRLLDAGGRIDWGARITDHPVRAADARISLRLQRGNEDDALMLALHGPDWYERAGADRGLLARHVTTVAFAVVSVSAAVAWTAMTLQFAWMRIAPGPRTRTEIGTMLATSVAIPFCAVNARLRGSVRYARASRKARQK